MNEDFNIVDLFCGAGGLSTGFSNAGFNVLLGVDSNPKAIETFVVNHETGQAICGDMKKITAKDIIDKIGNQKIDVIIGGPPCQGFSVAGRRDPNDPRNSMFKEYVKIVDAIRPKAFVMENVRGLLSIKNLSRRKRIHKMERRFSKRH